ncbi:MAG: hypothetical protein QF393_10665 [Rhodospirillales bacterium]|jgi:hypothetical protein|nr:hypothetical protein [Rhodospirillales bacterium]MDP6644931.1 hypothetical protein [Rhodospirillales bacterium]|tara:strand:+ start:1050 stop:1919 length:870 start_codon:yes stop_codon:yes gene_type:complete
MVRRQISRLKSLLAVFALLTLGACAAGYNIPKSNVNLADGFPPDAEAVASAIVEMLSGRNPSDTLRVRLAPGAGSGATDDSMDYRGFKLTGHSLIRHGSREQSPGKIIAAGVLKLTDSDFRRTSVIYRAEYGFVGDEIVISDIESATLFSIKPEAELFAVPRASMGPFAALSAASFDKLLKTVRAKRILPDAGVRGDKDYLIFVFLRDRISPSSKLEVKISDTLLNKFGYKDSSTYRDYNGWRIGVLQGTFDVTYEGLYIKAVFNPGGELPLGPQQVLGMYSLTGVRQP